MACHTGLSLVTSETGLPLASCFCGSKHTFVSQLPLSSSATQLHIDGIIKNHTPTCDVSSIKMVV